MRHSPLGYQMRRGRIVIIEKYAETVRWIFDSYIHGTSQKSIAKQLSEKRVPTGTGKYKWSQCSVRSILTNHKYMGDNFHPQIIDPYIFERAQARRKEKNKAVNTHPKTSQLQPLSRKCRCGKCGATYLYKKGSWRCANYIKDNKVSCNNDIYEDIDLLETILMVFQYLKDNPELVIAESEIRERKTNIKVNDMKLKIRKAEKNEHLSYKEFRELAYEKAQERYKVLPIWDRDYQNNKIQEFLMFHDIDMKSIWEITALIKCLELYADSEVIIILKNDLNFQCKVVPEKC